jgi:hypothetical protein
MTHVKEGDVLWFVKSKSKGQIVAVATFIELKERIIGPLIPLTLTDKELGWDKTLGEWDIEVHYKDLYNVSECNLISHITGAVSIRPYNERCKVNLIAEYPFIVRYSKVKTTMI